MHFKLAGIIIFSLWSSTLCYAQKIKVQKDQVFLDNKEVLKIQKSEVDKLKIWVVVTPQGDTAARFIEKRIELTPLPHETYKRRYAYYEVRFADADTTGYTSQYSLGGANRIADMLNASGCFAQGNYLGGCAEAVIMNNCDWSESKRADIMGANEWRDSILNSSAYLKYSATLQKRNASLPLEMLPDSSIMVFDVKIGKYHVLSTGTMSSTLRVVNHQNKPLATINYEPGRSRVFIRTFNDNAGKEYRIKHDFSQADINDAIAYLVDYGYL